MTEEHFDRSVEQRPRVGTGSIFVTLVVMYAFNVLLLTTIFFFPRWYFVKTGDFLRYSKDVVSDPFPIGLATLIVLVQIVSTRLIDFSDLSRPLSQLRWRWFMAIITASGWLPFLVAFFHPHFRSESLTGLFQVVYLILGITWTIIIVVAGSLGNTLPKVILFGRLTILTSICSVIFYLAIAALYLMVLNWTANLSFTFFYVFYALESLIAPMTFVLFPLGLFVVLLRMRGRLSLEERAAIRESIRFTFGSPKGYNSSAVATPESRNHV